MKERVEEVEKKMDNDWRLTNQMDYMYRATLRKCSFHKTPNNDHEHCEFCMEKFGKGEDMLEIGYCTLDEYHWVCKECFQDFCKQFEWKLIEIK